MQPAHHATCAASLVVAVTALLAAVLAAALTGQFETPGRSEYLIVTLVGPSDRRTSLKTAKIRYSRGAALEAS